MSRLIAWLALGGLTAALTACPTRAPSPPPPSPPPLRLPPGCDQGQAGEYYHAEDPAFRYRGEDDGGTLTLSVTRTREASEAPTDGGSAVVVVLWRRAEGFVGETQGTVFTPAGVACPVRFPTQAIRCDAAGLTLRAVVSTAIDENCTPATSGPARELEQRLLRGEPDAGSTDAGTADAGSADAGSADAGSADAGAPTQR